MQYILVILFPFPQLLPSFVLSQNKNKNTFPKVKTKQTTLPPRKYKNKKHTIKKSFCVSKLLLGMGVCPGVQLIYLVTLY